MPTDGTDVKVYTVGAEYAHAEARKSPGLDGKVERDEFGKEVRYPVILRADEKLIAMKICLAFKVSRRSSRALRKHSLRSANGLRLRSFTRRGQIVRLRCERIQFRQEQHEVLRRLRVDSRVNRGEERRNEGKCRRVLGT